MAFEYPGAGAPDYAPCRYGTSRLTFRGPMGDLSGNYAVALGGIETYGKFLRDPWPRRLSQQVGMPVLNLGCVNAGPEVWLNDPPVLELAGRAQVAVVQVVGAQNLSNRFYEVHPRRNDRFLRATAMLRAMYREVDFTEFHFTRHLLTGLQAAGPERFEILVEALKAAWVQRMITLLSHLPVRRVLVWMADHPPPAAGGSPDPMADPAFVDADMIAALRPHVAAYVEHPGSRAARAEGTRGMAFAPMEALAAESLPGPAVHGELAETLAGVLRRLC